MPLSDELLLEAYRLMLLMRRFDEKAGELMGSGEPIYETHPTIGQEGIIAGVCLALKEGDYIVPTYRCHGHCIARGMSVKAMMAELYGKRDGCCKGKGGPMHMGDITRGVLPGIGIVGAGIPLAVGVALALRMKGSDNAVACFFGDGATNTGVFHEGLNLAALWKLPVLFVCENNQYASRDPLEMTTPIKDLARRASSYGMPGIAINGNDFFQVYDAASRALGRARSGEGPTLLECRTFLLAPHSYNVMIHQIQEKEKELWEAWRAQDPLELMRKHLKEKGLLSDAMEEDIRRGVEEGLERALIEAKASPYPRPEEALQDLFSSGWR